MIHADPRFLYLGSTPSTNTQNYAVAVPFPSEGKAAFETSRMIDSARNANGEIVGRQIGRSIDKQNMAWDVLPREKWWEMNRWFEQGHFTFYCHYFNHNLGCWQTKLFYLGDVKTSPFLVDPESGEPAFYRDAGFNVIDCGVV